MSDRFWRVLAVTSRVDEFFIEADEFDSAEAAIQYVMADAHRGLDPENEHVREPIVVVPPAEVWLTDEDGERIEASSSQETKP